MSDENEDTSSEHPMECKACPDFYHIKFEKRKYIQQGKSIVMNVPVYECHSCGRVEPLISNREFFQLIAGLSDKMLAGKTYRLSTAKVFPLLSSWKKFKHFKHLELKYDARDHYLIPGLNMNGDGYLTPVFFKKDVLLYYNNHPDYTVRMDSFTTGNIYDKSGPLLSHGFGINRSGKLFRWLGDLNSDFKKESMKPHLKRFQAENIKSDHDVISKYYFSQIPFDVNDFFQESDNEPKLLEVRNKFDQNILDQYKFKFSKIDISNLPERYKQPIVNEQQQIFETYLALTKLLIETVQEDQLRNAIISSGFDLKGLEKKGGKKLGTLKLFELFITDVLKEAKGPVLITPLFVLYDLRLLHGHLATDSFSSRYDSCKSRLGANSKVTDLEFYELVISSLIQMFEKLNLLFNPKA
jgi:hypothetical protein